MSIKPKTIVRLGKLFDKIFWDLCMILIGIAFGYFWAWMALEGVSLKAPLKSTIGIYTK